MIRATIDIGTNTTHLLVGEVIDGHLHKILYKKRHYTLLGADGLEVISDAAIQRLDTALADFASHLNTYSTEVPIHIFATESLRSAANGSDIQDRIKNHYDWPMTIISGQLESQLILEGVRQSMDTSTGQYLIMDIGGGSVEFVLLVDDEVRFMESFPLGIARLYQQFHLEDPISQSSIQALRDHILSILTDLLEMIAIAETDVTLVGCAGTFEILLSASQSANANLDAAEVPIDRLHNLWSQIYAVDVEQRLLVPGLPKERAAYAVVALALIKTITDHLQLDQLIVSKYALKEGGIVDQRFYP